MGVGTPRHMKARFGLSWRFLCFQWESRVPWGKLSWHKAGEPCSWAVGYRGVNGTSVGLNCVIRA